MEEKRDYFELFSDKKGQLTIFIVIGVVVVSAIGLFFVFRGTGLIQTGGGSEEASTNSFLRTCLEDKTREAVRELSTHGGYLDNSLSIEFTFENEGVPRNISYLCYTLSAYNPCINQRPTLISDFENNMENYISEEVRRCLDELNNNFDEEGFEGNVIYNGFNVDVEPKRIEINTNSDATLTRNEETITESNYQVIYNSRIYEILQVSSEIVNQQAGFCNFDSQNFMLSYPEYRVRDINVGTDGDIYVLEHDDTNEEFRFAVRSCIIPPYF